MDPIVLFFILFVVVLIVSATLIYIWCCDRNGGCVNGGCSKGAEGVYLVGRDGRDGIPGKDGKDGVLVPDPSYAFLYVDNVYNEKAQDQEMGSLSLSSVKEQQQKAFASNLAKFAKSKMLNISSILNGENDEITTKSYLFNGNAFKTMAYIFDGYEYPVGLPYALKTSGTFSSISFDLIDAPKIILYDAGTLVKDFVFGLENVNPGENLYDNELYVKYQGEKTKRFHVSYTVNVTDESLGNYNLTNDEPPQFDFENNWENPARSGGIKLFFKKRENGQPSETKIGGSEASMGSYPNIGPNLLDTFLLPFQPAVPDINYSPFNLEVKHPITQTFTGNFWVSLSNGDVLKMYMVAKPYFVIPDVGGYVPWFGIVSLDNLRLSIKEID